MYYFRRFARTCEKISENIERSIKENTEQLEREIQKGKAKKNKEKIKGTAGKITRNKTRNINTENIGQDDQVDSLLECAPPDHD